MGLIPGILGGALSAVGTITDFVMSNLPASVSRGVVRHTRLHTGLPLHAAPRTVCCALSAVQQWPLHAL